MSCDQYVYISGKFAFRTDLDGVDFLRSECKRLTGTASQMVTRDAYHEDTKTLALGCTGEWLREQKNGVLSLQRSTPNE
jgi:hypothetical protein